MSKEIRLDTYLWAIRMFKSRSMASDAIKGGKVKLNNELVKASHIIKIGETYVIAYSGGVKKIIEVKDFLEKRQSFEIASSYYIDHTAIIEPTAKTGTFFNSTLKRDRGTGRPTKKERRTIDDSGLI